jgi:hypothetical protein
MTPSEARQRAEIERKIESTLKAYGASERALMELADFVAAEVQRAVQQERNEGQVRLANAVQRAVDGEREACAQIALIKADIATLIRARQRAGRS